MGRSVFAGMLLFTCASVAIAASSVQRDLDVVEDFDHDLHLNDLQSIGSHNSYKQTIPPAEFALISMMSEEQARALDYAHPPLEVQLSIGMRQLELDLYYDPEGGRFSDPLLPRLTQGQSGARAFDSERMNEPGFKVLHVNDVDVWSHCPTFVQCLESIRDWSISHPRHTPIMIMIEAKDRGAGISGTTAPLAFDEEAYDALDEEIRSVFEPGHLIVPDLVRGEHKTLREGVTNGGWPTLENSRGKVLFTLDRGSSRDGLYRRGKDALEGLVLFVSTEDFDAPYAAYRTMNNPLRDGAEIQAAVKRGFLIRTRADAGTKEARSGDTRRLEAALASGAQYISTDFYEAREEWSRYRAQFPSDVVTRCNPVRTKQPCRRK